MNILIIEDDVNIANLIAIHLNDISVKTTIKSNGWEGLDEAFANKYDLLILDVMLPGINGLEICRQIRNKQSQLPILMLTAKAEEEDKIVGLEIGADDYLTKPFSTGELLARVRAILRRAGRETKQLEQNLLKITRGDLELDLEQNTAYRAGKILDLTVKEFALLGIFMKNPNKSFTRATLLDEVWGESFEGLEHTVNSHINRLRAKIEIDPADPQYILTAWGVGYKLGNI